MLAQDDRVAADGVLIEAADLQTDESLLTGESLPVDKAASDLATIVGTVRSGGDSRIHVYSGSQVARGTGIARVVATGPRSEIGRIGQSLATLDTEAPRLRRETTRIVTWCAIGGGIVALLVVLLYGFLRGSWIEAVLAGIAIGMSMLPEEFPVVLTVFLAMGAWRIGLPLLFRPVHIALLQMVIDPVCALVFEAERDEDNVMARAPRNPAEPRFSLGMIAWRVFQGASAFAILVVVFFVTTSTAMPETQLRALMFFALIAEIVALILVNRSFSAALGEAFVRHNVAFGYVAAAIACVIAVILFVPAVQALLKFGSIRWTDMVLAAALGMGLLVLLEACKPLARRLAIRRSRHDDTRRTARLRKTGRSDATISPASVPQGL